MMEDQRTHRRNQQRQCDGLPRPKTNHCLDEHQQHCFAHAEYEQVVWVYVVAVGPSPPKAVLPSPVVSVRIVVRFKFNFRFMVCSPCAVLQITARERAEQARRAFGKYKTTEAAEGKCATRSTH